MREIMQTLNTSEIAQVDGGQGQFTTLAQCNNYVMRYLQLGHSAAFLNPEFWKNCNFPRAASELAKASLW